MHYDVYTVSAPDRDFISSDSLSYLPSSPNVLAAWSLTYLIKDAIARDVTVYYAISVKLQKKNSQRSFVGGLHSSRPTTVHGMFIAHPICVKALQGAPKKVIP